MLFAAYTEDMKHYVPEIAAQVKFSLQDPYVVIGLFIGGIAYLFGSLSMMAVGRSAAAVVEVPAVWRFRYHEGPRVPNMAGQLIF